MQIGLVDVLREEHGIVPAGMLGHSAGEIPAGYADGCLTLRQVCLVPSVSLQRTSLHNSLWLIDGPCTGPHTLLLYNFKQLYVSYTMT